MPAVGESAARDTLIESYADPLTRSLIRHALHHILGGPERDLTASIQTLGEGYEWLSVRQSGLHQSELPAIGLDVMRGRSVSLRPVVDSDLSLLYSAAIDPVDGYRWRFRGSTPSPGEFQALLYQEVLAQYVVVDTLTSTIQGLVVAYGYAPGDGYCHFGLQRVTVPGGRVRSYGQMTEGLGILIDYLFATWPLRKLYADVPMFNYQYFAGMEGIVFDVEARRREHVFHGGEWQDMITLAIYREVWEPFMAAWWESMSEGAELHNRKRIRV